MSAPLQRHSRRLHRLVVPIAAVPLALTALSGALYGTLLDTDLDTAWLLRLHTGNFGLVNLQPIYAPLIGIGTLVVVASGLALLRGRGRLAQGAQPADPGPEA